MGLPVSMSVVDRESYHGTEEPFNLPPLVLKARLLSTKVALPFAGSTHVKGTCTHVLSKIRGLYAKFHACYRMVLPQTVYFQCNRKIKKEKSALILCTFEPSATKLQRP